MIFFTFLLNASEYKNIYRTYYICKSEKEEKIIKLSDEKEQRAIDIHKKSIILDACYVTSLDPKEGIYFNELKSGGVTAAVKTVAGEGDDFLTTLKSIDTVIKTIEENPEQMMLATTTDDIRRAKKEEKVAVVLGLQGCAGPINAIDIATDENAMSNLRILYKLGVRVIQLTYNFQTAIGTGCCSIMDGKLSWLGRKIVEEMNKMGIVVDVSHCSGATTMDAINLSKDTVVFTHANAYSINPSPRNKTDEQIQAMAEQNGVMGIKLLGLSPVKKPDTIEHVLNQIDYVVDLVDINHVGIGLDMNRKGADEGYCSGAYRRVKMLGLDVYNYHEKGQPTTQYPPFPKGLDRYDKLPNLTRGLVARGYSDGEIKKILGENFIRVFKKVWGR